MNDKLLLIYKTIINFRYCFINYNAEFSCHIADWLVKIVVYVSFMN